jgi:hypothetical protein
MSPFKPAGAPMPCSPQRRKQRTHWMHQRRTGIALFGWRFLRRSHTASADIGLRVLSVADISSRSDLLRMSALQNNAADASRRLDRTVTHVRATACNATRGNQPECPVRRRGGSRKIVSGWPRSRLPLPTAGRPRPLSEPVSVLCGVHLISVQEVTVRTCPDREDWRGIYFDDARKCLSRLEFLLVSRAAAEGLFAWSNSAASTRFLCSL